MQNEKFSINFEKKHNLREIFLRIWKLVIFFLEYQYVPIRNLVDLILKWQFKSDKLLNGTVFNFLKQIKRFIIWEPALE